MLWSKSWLSNYGTSHGLLILRSDFRGKLYEKEGLGTWAIDYDQT